MTINKLKIHNFRNLSAIDSSFSPGINIIHGKNGSGKTSLLESIYYLGLNRSFRSHINSRIIQYGEESFSLFAEIGENRLGIEKGAKLSAKIRLNNEDIRSISKIAEILPLQLIDSQTFHLINSGPEYRRQFMDWGVFHVEQQYMRVWKRFQRVLKQRNAAIREKQPPNQVKIWDEEFVSLSKEIDERRNNYFSGFLLVFKETLEQLLSLDGLALHYFAGWGDEKRLEDLVLSNFSNDLRFGYTFYGPHRADIKITVDKIPAKDVLSRGQQKLLVSALRIAQAIYLKKQSDREAILLVDDLPAELDGQRKQALCGLLEKLDTQIFITSIEKETLKGCFCGDQVRMFHVERGSLKF